MLKKLPLLVALVSWAGYSYSESIAPYYGTTPNAAAGGHTWSMDSVLPSGVPGLDIDLVIYNYTPIKETQDDMVVHIQNENANGTGYIFRESDDWSGLQGGVEIRKVVPVIPNIPRAQWGDGSIEVEGTGTVEDASVIYNYRVDPCFDPQFDPNCPGYEVIVPEIETVDVDDLYDPLQDDTIQDALAETDNDQYDEDTESEEDRLKEEEEEEKDSKERLEKALAAVDNTVLFAEAFAQDQLLQAMNLAINMSPYYAAAVDGGTYTESITLVDKELPENKRGLRNGLAQQLLHEKMVEMQY